MKLVSEIRRENLALLLAKEESRDAFAAKIGKDRNQIYQWLLEPGTPGARNIGPVSVREIETALGLPRAWMDHEHPMGGMGEAAAPPSVGASQVGRIDPRRLRDAMEILAELAKEQIGPDTGGFAHDYRYIAITYNYLLARNETVGPSNIIELRRGVVAQIRSELGSAPPERSAA